MPAGELTYTEVAPPTDLAGVVDRFWLRASRRPASGRTQRILPDGCVDVIVDVERGAAELVGAMTRAIEVPDGPGRVVAVRFKPGTAAAVARCALGELTDEGAAVEDLGIADGALAGRIHDARHPAAQLTVLADWLRGRLAAAPAPVGWIARAVAQLSSPSSRTSSSPVEAVADTLGVSRQHLARSFRREVGLSPKQLARIARMQRAVAALAGATPDLARLAVELGYFDQAHLTNELHALTGATPSALASERPTAMVHLFGGPATPSARLVPFLQARRLGAP